MDFKIIAKDAATGARAGVLTLERGVIAALSAAGRSLAPVERRCAATTFGWDLRYRRSLALRAADESL